jgi:glycosyltransferase involved in cell wall biosynthesis
MKVALLAPTFSWFSGIDRVVYDQAQQLLSKGNQVEIFTFAADMEPPKGVNIHIFGMPKALFWQRMYRLLLPFLFWNNGKLAARLNGFDTIYSHQYPMNWLAYQAKKNQGSSYIYYDYGIAPPAAFSTMAERLYMSIFRVLSNWTAIKCDCAVSISCYLKEALERDTGLVSEVVYPMIEKNRFHTGLNGMPVRIKYGIGDSPLILYVGRISPHKGIHLLIKSFLQIKHEFPDAKLLIVGKHTFDRYSSNLKAMSDESVIFAGYVPDADIPIYYAACEIYATATFWEGFNLPLAEAQACGKPVVAFNIGPHPEVVLDGETGYLVKPYETDEMTKAFVRLLGQPDLQREMGSRAAMFVQEKFT